MGIHWSRCRRDEQVFTHEAIDGTIRHFAVERLFNYMKGIGREVVSVQLEQDFVSTILERRGVEARRIERMRPEHLDIPVLYLKDVTPGTHLLADGHHRYLIHARIGSDWVPAYIAEPKLWQRFMVEGIPDEYSRNVTLQPDAYSYIP